MKSLTVISGNFESASGRKKQLAMDSNDEPGGPPTSHTLLVRICAADQQLRADAWTEFCAHYRPIITGFARRMGARGPDIDDVIQEVLAGFAAASASFVYDPAKGRFRSYLRACTFRILRRRLGNEARLGTISLDALGPDAVEVEQVWNDIWELEHLRRAVEATRRHYRCEKTFRAFELHFILGKPGPDVARELDMSVDSVYKACERIVDAIRARMRSIEEGV